jgi:hypothetical protein
MTVPGPRARRPLDVAKLSDGNACLDVRADGRRLSALWPAGTFRRFSEERFASGSPAKGSLMGDAGGIERMRPFCFSAIASAGPQAKGRSAFRAWRSPRKRQRALAFAQNEDGLTAVVASSGLVPKKNPGHEARGYQFGRSCRNRRAGVARSGSSRGHPCNDWRRPTGVATGVAAGDAEGVAPSGASITNGSLNAEYSQTM